jgi:ribosomal protein L37AE/L43A
MWCEIDDEETVDLLQRYLVFLDLPAEQLRVTTDRRVFAAWLGRRVRYEIGGAYVFLPRLQEHAILINLERIDRSRKRAVEIVVAEELIHMRDHLDGDHRRHAKHGHDRIAIRVASLTGVSLDEVRRSLVPRQRRPMRYVYACPACGLRVQRRLRGTWSCGRCATTFDRRFRLQLVLELRSERTSFEQGENETTACWGEI